MNSIIGKILDNPMYMVQEYENRFVLSFYGYNKIIYLGGYDNIVDALDERDLFIKEWYGDNAYNELISNYPKEKTERTYVRVGNFSVLNGYIVGRSRSCSPVVGKKLVLKAILGNKRRQICVDRDIIVQISKEKKVCIINPNKKSNNKLYAELSDGDVVCKNTPSKGIAYNDIILNKSRKRKIPRDPNFVIQRSYGVVFFSAHQKYSSSISLNGKYIYVSGYLSFEDARDISFDFYYMLHGKFHKTDPRRIK